MQPLKKTHNARRDPAPSRAAYKAQRLMLTPGFRRFLRVGLPVIAIAGAVGIFLSDADRRDALELKVSEMRRAIEERPEFMVNLVAIDGAGDAVAADIREIIPVEFPITAFDLDLEDLRANIAQMDAVDSVDVQVRSGILQINVTERVPVLVWRTYEGTILLDATGHRVAPIASREERSDLPLVAGDGADVAVEQALEIITASGPLLARVRGIERIGERRWDLVLDRNQRILLPEDNPIAALERVIALNKAQDMLARDLTVIDMRNGQRPTIRIADNAIEALRQIRAEN
ncbi:cell division protein FtsQ/DivIB [Profundibacter amoris]|uniref:Cell division protein FtsQ n=1 Tax=Profundibacter amoris TaxID=2171755 RepID=A0A347UF05_9RHOB|nr:cell division protein FtsQ/DivIB [Profundibacter amoris]AXX97433.1 cell division protein FtsQ [Profundibacter amoris]